MMTGSVTLRPIRPDDEPLLFQVYASTRLDELAPLGWDTAQVEAFLSMQFTAQHQYYQARFPQAAFQIILWHGRPVGRFYVDRRQDEIRLIDIAILPAYRNAGIGTALVRDLLREAAWLGKPVRIHVERQNRALRLYERLGFTPFAEQGVHLLMTWTPGTT